MAAPRAAAASGEAGDEAELRGGRAGASLPPRVLRLRGRGGAEDGRPHRVAPRAAGGHRGDGVPQGEARRGVLPAAPDRRLSLPAAQLLSLRPRRLPVSSSLSPISRMEHQQLGFSRRSVLSSMLCLLQQTAR